MKWEESIGELNIPVWRKPREKDGWMDVQGRRGEIASISSFCSPLSLSLSPSHTPSSFLLKNTQFANRYPLICVNIHGIFSHISLPMNTSHKRHIMGWNYEREISPMNIHTKQRGGDWLCCFIRHELLCPHLHASSPSGTSDTPLDNISGLFTPNEPSMCCLFHNIHTYILLGGREGVSVVLSVLSERKGDGVRVTMTDHELGWMTGLHHRCSSTVSSVSPNTDKALDLVNWDSVYPNNCSGFVPLAMGAELDNFFASSISSSFTPKNLRACSLFTSSVDTPNIFLKTSSWWWEREKWGDMKCSEEGEEGEEVSDKGGLSLSKRENNDLLNFFLSVGFNSVMCLGGNSADLSEEWMRGDLHSEEELKSSSNCIWDLWLGYHQQIIPQKWRIIIIESEYTIKYHWNSDESENEDIEFF